MLRLDTARNAIALAMYDLEVKTRSKGAVRNTTQEVFNTMHSTVTSGPDYVVGTLYANDYWTFVGNGRGPGGMPPVQKIQDWVDRSGATVNAYALAKKIAKEGTRDFRMKRPNVFLSSIDAWRDGASVDAVAAAGARDLENAAVEIVVTNLKRKA